MPPKSLKAEVLDTLEDLSWHRDQQAERKRQEVYTDREEHDAEVAKLCGQVEETDRLYARFRQAYVLTRTDLQWLIEVMLGLCSDDTACEAGTLATLYARFPWWEQEIAGPAS